ncbi:MAG: ectonucleotide pyrophosphatase/phosphodiesterase [Sphingomonadales bacterium]|nr:ectonucleotide pyrophosphatase/phosphodiesterase [Sphingomonadales bacterium]
MKRLLLAAAALLLPTAAPARPLLLISLDGLRAADSHDAAQMTELAALAAVGQSAQAVRGTWPTLTYPAHTTLITGRSPAEHGIGGNEAFDPTDSNDAGWMWYAEDIRGDTLWAAARRAGLTTAAINWPVTVGAPIDFNIPQVWRSWTAPDPQLTRALATPGLEQRLATITGAAYPAGAGGTCDADSIRARYAAALLAAEHPALTAVHLECIDHAQHDYGPDSPQAAAARIRIDAVLGTLIRVARATRPDIAIAVVSDHGFAPVHTAVNLEAAFRDAGLGAGTPGWQAAAWPMVGTAAVILRDPADAAVRARVAALLDRLAADPRLGIARVLSGADAAATAGTPRAAFWIAFKPGYTSGGHRHGPLVQRAEVKGSHGDPPDDPAMLAAFVLGEQSPAISPGVIDMRAIAPMLAGILGVQLR